MIDAANLLVDTRRTVSALVDDLREVATNDPAARALVGDEYQRAHAAGRTAFGQAEWAEGLYAQVAVAWTLGCVFIRFCEDNDLITEPLLGGPGLRAQLALDQRAAHLDANPSHDDRDWLREAFRRLRALPATGDIFGDHNPIWLEGLLPSADGARRLREELTRIDPDTGRLRHDFTDPEWDTRFLGDLYQDLSDHAKKTYALLQTPTFVEEFILDRTLDPAISTFGLADTTLIDPTCGSGHFLLGAFGRLFARRLEAEPSTNRRALAQRTLDAIGGVDLNPFAASVARFRLLLAALRAGGDVRLSDAPAYHVSIAVGDSLLHGDPPGALPGMHIPGEEEALLASHGYALEDHSATRELLGRRWTAVVGNPPYITVKDPALNGAYRKRFRSCSGKFSLGVPFTERFWQLAEESPTDSSRAGFVGLITSNSFMKREMGKKLIEQWVPRHDLTLVVDSSGAYIPGHGTPTVILFGRNRAPVARTVRAVMGIRGEPSRPSDPENGAVWTSIVDLVDKPGSQSTFVSVVDLERTRLTSHPWSIGGGGAAELKELLDGCSNTLSDHLTVAPGVMAICGYDELAMSPRGVLRRYGVEEIAIRPLVRGEDVRDWLVHREVEIFFPHLSTTELLTEESLPAAARRFWPVRTTLWSRATFSKDTYRQAGRHWWQWHQLSRHRLSEASFISYAHVATHAHFAESSKPAIHNPHAALVDIRESSSEILSGILGVLNSSAGCFWMQQVFHNKGGPGGGSSKDEKWNDFYEHDGTKLKQFPLPDSLPISSARLLQIDAQALASVSPFGITDEATPTEESLSAARDAEFEIRSRMTAAQERLDWEVYALYGLADADEVAPSNVPEPPLQLGQRAFEIVLARRSATGQPTKWFSKFGAAAIVEPPSHWSREYRRLVERRIALIENDINLGLIERPESKRRWEQVGWDERAAAALRGWLLDRLETRRYWPTPSAVTTVARLTAGARADEDFVRVARLYAGRGDFDLGTLIRDLVAAESVGYLAALRYTESGMRKHRAWLHTWELQRQEDVGGEVAGVPVPPKYGKADFTHAGWENRGKLDIPKERFIVYPGAERESDVSAAIGWAGWDHLERARALAAWYLQAKRDGRDKDHLTPLLAGLAELVPWLKQWYDEPNADPSLDRPGSQVAALVDTELRSLGLTRDDLAAWRPPTTAKRGRPRKASA